VDQVLILTSPAKGPVSETQRDNVLHKSHRHRVQWFGDLSEKPVCWFFVRDFLQHSGHVTRSKPASVLNDMVPTISGDRLLLPTSTNMSTWKLPGPADSSINATWRVTTATSQCSLMHLPLPWLGYEAVPISRRCLYKDRAYGYN